MCTAHCFHDFLPNFTEQPGHAYWQLPNLQLFCSFAGVAWPETANKRISIRSKLRVALFFWWDFEVFEVFEIFEVFEVFEVAGGGTYVRLNLWAG